MKPPTGHRDMNAVISDLLRAGVIVSTALVVLGTILIFVHTPASFPDSIQQLVSSNYGRPPLTLGGFLGGLEDGSPSFVLQLGLIVLLATPVARVAASVLLFASEHDRKYVAITLFVLVLLLVSTFLIGPLEAKTGG